MAKNRMHDVSLTAMDKLVFPTVETAVRSVTGSTGQGPNSEVQNTDRKDLLGNAGNTLLMSISSRLDLNLNQDRKYETRNEENFEVGDFRALRPNYDRRVPTHHSHILNKVSWVILN